MLKRRNRINRTVFDFVFKTGVVYKSDHIVLHIVKGQNENSDDFSVSFIVPKKTQKSAIKRNLLKRKCYEIIRELSPSFKNQFLGIFIIKKPILNNKYTILKDEITILLKNINVI